MGTVSSGRRAADAVGQCHGSAPVTTTGPLHSSGYPLGWWVLRWCARGEGTTSEEMPPNDVHRRSARHQARLVAGGVDFCGERFEVGDELVDFVRPQAVVRGGGEGVGDGLDAVFGLAS